MNVQIVPIYTLPPHMDAGWLIDLVLKGQMIRQLLNAYLYFLN